jgi:hypothetical protein
MEFLLISFGNEVCPARTLNANLMSLSVTEDILTELDNMSTQIFAKIKEFFLANETKIMLVIGFCLISAISYEFGVLQGQKWQQKPLIIEKPSDTQAGQETVNQGNLEASGTTKTAVASQIATNAAISPNMANCAFVGSKSSNKFYLPTCSYAKRVKPENLVCFKSAEEALGQGRTESKCSK